MLAKKLGGKGNVVTVKGLQDHDAAIGRTKAVKAVLAGHPGIQNIAEGFGNWKRSAGQRIVAELLKKGEAIDAIAAKEGVPKELMVPFELVTAENVARYAAR